MTTHDAIGEGSTEGIAGSEHMADGSPIPVVNVVMAGDRRVKWGCAVAGRSLVEHTPPGTEVHFYLMHPGTNPEEIDRFRRSWQVPGRCARVFDVVFELDRVRDLIRSKHVTHMAYARLFAADLLPPTVARCIYIDTDVMFELNALELFQHPIGQKTIAAVPDGDGSDDAAHFHRLQIAGTRYFNSGVMVIDLDRWRERKIGQQALEFFRGFRGRLALQDQDALNAVLANDWFMLDGRWNSWASRSHSEGNRVIHFTMVPKPWHPDFTGSLRSRFFCYLDRTEFAGQRPPHWFGIAPTLARLRRRVPYWPSVPRILAHNFRSIASTLRR